MIRFALKKMFLRHGTAVTLRFRDHSGKYVRVSTRAVVNVYRKGLERSTADALMMKRNDLGKPGRRYVLFLPFDVLDQYDGKSEIFVMLRDDTYVMQATTTFPLGENDVYTWMIVEPRHLEHDDYRNMGE